MANVGFVVIGALGALCLALGLFPAFFGGMVLDAATPFRIAGFVLVGAAFTVRSVLRR